MAAIPYPSPSGQTAVRLEWPHLPPWLRKEIESRLGSPVVEALSQDGGFTPGFASVLVCEDGSRAFVKAASTIAQRAFAGAYRDEVCVVVTLPPGTAHDDAVKSVRAVTGAHGLTAQVHIAEAIPRTPVGKPDKPLIRRRWIEEGSHG